MKKVIFICLLSLSVCLSKPSDQAAAPAQQSPNAAPVDPKGPPKPADPATTTVTAAHVEAQTNAAGKPSETASPSTAITPKTELPAKADTPVPATGTKPNETKQNGKDNSAEKKSETVTPAKGKDENKVEVPKNDTNSKTDKATTDKDAKNATTPASGNKEVTTPKAEASTKASEIHIEQARGFDGPSFIGGIILTLGILAIGFMGFKYYKNQTERNYHTL